MHVTGNSVPPYWTSFDPFHSSIDFFYRKFVFYFVLKISASSRLLDNEYKLPSLSSSNRLMSDSKTSSDYSVKCTERCYIALVVDDLCFRSYLELEWEPFGIELNWRKNPLGSLSTSDVCFFTHQRIPIYFRFMATFEVILLLAPLLHTLAFCADESAMWRDEKKLSQKNNIKMYRK